MIGQRWHAILLLLRISMQTLHILFKLQTKARHLSVAAWSAINLAAAFYALRLGIALCPRLLHSTCFAACHTGADRCTSQQECTPGTYTAPGALLRVLATLPFLSDLVDVITVDQVLTMSQRLASNRPVACVTSCLCLDAGNSSCVPCPSGTVSGPGKSNSN